MTGCAIFGFGVGAATHGASYWWRGDRAEEAPDAA
jgi:hypothetical protein